MSQVTFSIRENIENGETFFEVWRRSWDSYGEMRETLLLETNTRDEARKVQSHYATLEKKTF